MKMIALAATVSALAIAAPADAALLQYSLSGFDTLANGEVVFASFQVDSNPTPSFLIPAGGFQVANVSGTFTYGATTTTGPRTIGFLATSNRGGFNVPGALLDFTGPQLYSGTAEAPTLLTGVFTVNDGFSNSPFTLTVSAVTTSSPVPEPATWAMMMLGFGGAGYAMRRKPKVTSRIRFA